MSPIDVFLGAVTSATIGEVDVWADEAIFDATVPNWRFRLRGPDLIRQQFAKWYADPGRFEEISRITLGPDGELVQFVLAWSEHGVPHATREAHVIRVSGDRISEHVVYCGGRWPAGLLAQMAEAEANHA